MSSPEWPAVALLKKIISPITLRLTGYFDQLLSRHIPAERRVVLNRRKIFILPTASGLGFLTTAVLVWLAGTNYENNLALGLAYLMISLFVIAILHTYANLSGLAIQALEAHPAFVGEDAEVTIKVERLGARWRENISLHWPGNNVAMIHLLENTDTSNKLFFAVHRRGWVNPGRVVIESTFPLGLLRAWSRVDLALQLLVYPKPVVPGPVPPSQGSADEGEELVQSGGEDFNGYKNYQPGDPLKHVDWKHVARGRGLLTKQYSAYADQQCWLDWDVFAGLDREARLSRLCGWVLDISKTESEYGLRLPGQQIKPGKGLLHKQQVLKALALFEWDKQMGVRRRS